MGHFICWLFREKEKHKQTVRKMYDGKGIDGMTKEEMRDYYQALGKWDMCRSILNYIAKHYGWSYYELKVIYKKINQSPPDIFNF